MLYHLISVLKVHRLRKNSHWRQQHLLVVMVKLVPVPKMSLFPPKSFTHQEIYEHKLQTKPDTSH